MNFSFQSKLDSSRTITERNKVFHTLSAEDQRKEISYDLLMLILNKHLDACEGGYWDGEYLDNHDQCTTPEELHIYLNNFEKHGDTCEVCARGGMMLSQIRLGNTVSPHDLSVERGNKENIIGFTFTEFWDMEALYEGLVVRTNIFGVEHNPWIVDHPFQQHTRARLVNICLNVIVNGCFEKYDYTNYVERLNVTIPELE